jgi:peptide/nickel transport system substrate-binding protein
MFGKKAARLLTAVLLVGTVMGAQGVAGATTHRAQAAEQNVITETDFEFPDGCNFLAATSAANAELCNPMLDTLFLLDNHLNYQPDLAANIPTPKNGEVKTVNGNLQVTFKLKPNLKWSDGSPLTVDDFIFSVKMNLAAGNTTGIDQIASMKKVNSSTLIVTYKGIYAPYVAYGNPVPFVPQKYLEKKYGTTDITAIANKFLTDPYNSPSDVFAGAYKIQSWANNQSIVLVPNSNFTALPPANGHARPTIKFVNISGSQDGVAAALQSPNAGIDWATDFQFTNLPALLAAKNYRVHALPALFEEHLELNQAGSLKDVRLRRALELGIDKKALFQTLFPSLAGQANTYLLHTVIPNLSPWADLKLPVSPYDPNKAKQLLQQAGYSTNYSGPGKHLYINFATTTSGVRPKTYEIIAKYWARIGVHTDAHFYTALGANSLFGSWAEGGVLYHRRYDVALFAYQENPDPQQNEGNFNPALVPGPTNTAGTNQNYNGITDQDQWSLLVQARHALDNSQRHAIFNRWQTLLNSRSYWIMLYARQNISAESGKIGNFKPNPSQATDTWNAYQWYKVGAS